MTPHDAQQANEKYSAIDGFYKNSHTPFQLLIYALIILVYYFSAQLGLMLAFEQANTSPVWPPTGIAVATLLYFGIRFFPAIFIAALITNYLTGVSFPVATGIAIGNTLEGVIATYMIVKFADRIPFSAVSHVLKFILIILFATTISASIGVTSLSLGGNVEWSSFMLLWSTWWIGDIVGALVITPLLLTWIPLTRTSFYTDRPLEIVSLFGSALLCSIFVFSDWLHISTDNYPLTFLFIPFAVWAALRFQQKGVTAIIFLLSIFSIYGTLEGFGPFVRPSANESLLLLQSFMGIMVISTLMLAASIDENIKTSRALHEATQSLEQRVRQRTEQLTHANRTLESEVINRQRTAETLSSLLADTSSAGDALFHSCLNNLATIFDAKYAFISTFTDHSRTTLRTLAFWAEGRIIENYAYPIKGTICEDVLQHKMKLVSEQAAQQYPEAVQLKQLAIESYFGAALIAPSQVAFGVVIVMDTKPILTDSGRDSILGIVANRLALEIDRSEKEDELKLAASVFNEAIEAIAIADKDGNVLRVNPAFCHITGFNATDVIGKNPIEWGLKQENADFYKALWETLLNDGVWQGELWGRRKNGEAFPTSQTISTVKNNAGEVIQFISIFSDISEKMNSEEQIYHLAHYDLVTNLPNRTAFQNQIEHALAHANRQNSSLALLYLDLDNFKVLNDAFGHPTGDILLRQVAQRLTDILREDDIIAHIGGDEFTILITDIENSQVAAQIAEKIIKGFTAPFKHEAIEMVITASIGICTFPADGSDAHTLLKNADSAMYQAKKNGRNNFQFFTAEMNALAHDRLSMEADIRKALERDEFILHYQPQVCLKTGNIIGCEALVRWEHPSKGLISPYFFIPVAEESGLIIPLSEWVMRTAITQLQQWHHADLYKTSMSVNMSAHQFGKQNLTQILKQILDKTHLDAKYLELELTESILMTNTDATIETLNELRDMGIQLSIDDFGTGYSSMAYLKKFPIDKLKIDQSFVRELEVDSDDAAIVSAIIALGHRLNLTVIAEGVETEQQLEFLHAEQCEQIQGYYFSRPIPAEDFFALLKSKKNIWQ